MSSSRIRIFRSGGCLKEANHHGAKKLGRTLNDRRVAKLIHPLRFVDNSTNLFYLAADYAVMIATLVGATALCVNRVEWGIPWWGLIPAVAVAIFLVGACQHRLAGLGHEASHYMFMKNRVLNELLSDLFCMFPIFTTTDQYRQIHLGHHEFTNDWERDPEILNVAERAAWPTFP